jgi:glutathione S-transferase
MKIYGDVLSPFTRLCLVAAQEVGLKDRVSLVKTNVKPDQINDALLKLSATGKIPVLETDHHHPIHDSRVIVEYLAHVAGNKTLIPDDGVKRFRVLTLLSLALGAGEAAVSLRYETFVRPENFRWRELANRFEARFLASCDDMNENWLEVLADVNAASLAAACVIDYAALRHPHLNWRHGRNSLAEAIDSLLQRDSFKLWPLAG